MRNDMSFPLLSSCGHPLLYARVHTRRHADRYARVSDYSCLPTDGEGCLSTEKKSKESDAETVAGGERERQRSTDA